MIEWAQMDQQWLPVFISLLTPIATLAIVMVGFLYNNARMNELSQHINGRMNDLRDMLRAEIAKNQSALLMKFAELENRLGTRLSRIESHMNLG